MGEGATVRGEVTAGGTSAMAAAHTQERTQTVQSHPTRQAGSAPKHAEEGAREVLISLNPSWRKGSCCQCLSPPLPPLAAISLRCREPRGSRRGEEMLGQGELPAAPQEADWSGTGYERRHRAERLLPSLHPSPAWYG